MSIHYPARERLANLPTPLQPLHKITERFSRPYGGPNIWVKRDDLTESAMSGNKLRKLEFIIAEAKAQGCNTLITCGGEQSNHCRATALAAARTGLKSHLILRQSAGGATSDTPDGNLLVDYLAGAKVSLYPLKEYVNQLPQLFGEWASYYLKRGDRALCIPTGGSDGLGIWGYILGAEELLTDCRDNGFEPDRLICASGSGGTQAGLTLGCQMLGAQARVTGYAVCDSEDYFVSKIRDDIRLWAEAYSQVFPFDAEQIHVSDKYIGPGYGVAGEEIFQTISLVAQLEGILLDPVYTGKAFYGLLKDIEQGLYADCRHVVFVHTGGHFGVFPQRTGFSAAWGQQ